MEESGSPSLYKSESTVSGSEVHAQKLTSEAHAMIGFECHLCIGNQLASEAIYFYLVPGNYNKTKKEIHIL